MERRGFLQGLFGGVAGAGLLVVAKPHEIEAFAGPLRNGAPLVLDRPAVDPVAIDEFLYNSRGEKVCVITQITSERFLDVDDSHTFGRSLRPGIGGDTRIEALALGPVEWNQHGPRLRGA